MDDPVPTLGSIPLNCPTFSWQAKEHFPEWRCFRSEVENVFAGPYAAMEGKQKPALTINWMYQEGSEIVN